MDDAKKFSNAEIQSAAVDLPDYVSEKWVADRYYLYSKKRKLSELL